MKEEWKEVPFAKGYLGSTLGRVKKSDGTILRQVRRVRRYRGVFVSGKVVLTSRLILRTFAGDPPPGKNEAMHLNSIPEDNRLCNLRWGSHSENMAMDRGNKHAHKGRKNPNAKLTQAKVDEIRLAYLKGGRHSRWGCKAFAKRFAITTTQVGRIARCENGGWI